jgi:phosphatidylserine synthase
MQTHRSHTGALVGGALLITFGLLSLAGEIFRGFNWGLLWPFFVIGAGILFFVAMFAGGKQTAGFAIPATIISGIGLVLLIQNITHHWESMSYFWTLVILFVGAGIYVMGLYADDIGQKQSGMRVMRIGLILFIIFGVFFELIFSHLGNIGFPIILILLGVYLILNRSGLLGKKQDDTSSDSVAPVNENSSDNLNN